MSSNLIVQLSCEPITNFMSAEDFANSDDSFIGQIADYVYEASEPYETMISMFLECLNGSVEYNKDKNSIKIIDKKKYFESYYNEFLKLTENLSIEKYMDLYWSYMLRKNVNENFGVYVLVDYAKSLQDQMLEANEGDEYFIGGIFCYHF